MPETPFIKTDTAPAVSPKKRNPLIGLLFGVLFFVVLVGTSAFVTVSIIQKNQPGVRKSTPTAIELDRLLTPCLLYYRDCETSYAGLSDPATLTRMLELAESPILQRGTVDFVQSDNQIILLPPTEVLTNIAAKNDLNPFLMATLSELQYGTFFKKSVDVDNKINFAGGVKSAFMGQHLQMAQQLHDLEIQYDLLAKNPPEHINEYLSEKFNVTVTFKNGSAADMVIIKYLESAATSSQNFQDMVTDFATTYRIIAAVDPENGQKTLKEEFIPTPTISAEDQKTLDEAKAAQGDASTSATQQ